MDLGWAILLNSRGMVKITGPIDGGLKTAATKPFALGERFRHEDEVARQFRLDLLGEGGRAGFDVAQPPVEWRQLRAQAYDAYVHRAATGGARTIFRFIYQMQA